MNQAIKSLCKRTKESAPSGKLPPPISHISQTEGSTSHRHAWLLRAGSGGGDDGGLRQSSPPPTLLA